MPDSTTTIVGLLNVPGAFDGLPDVCPGADKPIDPQKGFGVFGDIGDGVTDENGFLPLAPFEKTAQESLPPFPWDALPPALSNMAETLSDSAETDFALAAVPALANCAVAIGRKFLANPKPGWNEPLNLYVITAAASGDRKSSVMTPLNNPIYDFQDDFNERQACVVAQWQDDLELTSGEIAETKRKIAKGKATRDDLARLTERKRQLEQNPERPLCLFAQDCTPEELEQLLSENGETLAFICSEGGIMETMTGKRYSDGVNLEALLNSYTGDTVKVDRIGRPKVYLRRPCLNINVMAQPITVQELISVKTFNRRGLNGRFLYAFPPSRVGYRTGDRPEPLPEAVNAYNELISALLELKADRDERDRETPRIIPFSEEARESRLAFCRECEALLRDIDPESPFMTWAKRFEPHAVRLAGVLHVCEYRNEADAVPLSAVTFQKGVTLARYFKAHAEYAFSLSGASESEEERDARYIWKRIRESGQDQFAKRDLIRLCRRFKGAAEMESGLKGLAERGYIRIEERRTAGRPAVTVHANPEALKEN